MSARFRCAFDDLAVIFRDWMIGIGLLFIGMSIFLPAESKNVVFVGISLGLVLSCLILSVLCLVCDFISGSSILADGFYALGLVIAVMLLINRGAPGPMF